MGEKGMWKDRLNALQTRTERLMSSPRARRVMKVGRLLFVGLVLAYLAYRFTSIGWATVLSALPTSPFFYATILVMYFLLPFSEALIYSRVWKTRYRRCLAPLLYKRVLNQDIVDYSGEVYLFVWAKDRLGVAKRTIAASMKDNLIISSIVSISTAVGLVGLLLGTGLIIPTDLVDDPSWMYVVAGAIIAMLIGGLITRFRRAIFSLPRHLLAGMSAVHATRFLSGYVLQVVQWWIVVPEASFQSWALLLVLMVVTNRIPLLPSKDLVFVGAGVEMSAMLDVPVASVASMLLVRSLSDKVLNLVIFALYSLRREDRGNRVVPHDENAPLASYNARIPSKREVPALNAQ